MKKNTKKYYATHFGDFNPLSAAEVNELCVYESWLPALPVKLFFPSPLTAAGDMPAKTALREYIKKALSLLQN